MKNSNNIGLKIYKKSPSSQLRDEKLYFAVPLLLEFSSLSLVNIITCHLSLKTYH